MDDRRAIKTNKGAREKEEAAGQTCGWMGEGAHETVSDRQKDRLTGGEGERQGPNLLSLSDKKASRHKGSAKRCLICR